MNETLIRGGVSHSGIGNETEFAVLRMKNCLDFGEPGIDLTDLLNDKEEVKIIEYFECIERKIEYNFGLNT